VRDKNTRFQSVLDNTSLEHNRDDQFIAGFHVYQVNGLTNNYNDTSTTSAESNPTHDPTVTV